MCDLKFVQTRDCNKYFITFIDDELNTVMCIYLKAMMMQKFLLYKNEVENQFNKRIKMLRSDQNCEAHPRIIRPGCWPTSTIPDIVLLGLSHSNQTRLQRYSNPVNQAFCCDNTHVFHQLSCKNLPNSLGEVNHHLPICDI